MKEKIKGLCKQIEKEKGIKILFAVENGSRAWGMESEDSDYDIRFVYHREVKDYLCLNPSDEVIKASFDKEGNKAPAEGCFFDIVGFDLFKFARMLSSSNPQVIEWLCTDIVYLGKQNKVFQEYAEKCFKQISLYYHYKSMCKQNYLKYLKSGNLVTYKKYLYAMRGLINARYVANFKVLPPINFIQTLETLDKLLPLYVVERLKQIVELKKEGKEKDIIENETKIDNYIEEFLKDDSEAPKEKKLSTQTELNQEVQKILGV